MKNVKRIAINTISNPKAWGVAAVFVAGYYYGDWRGVVRANKVSDKHIKNLDQQIAAYEKLTEVMSHRNSVQSLTLNAYDNLANAIAGGGNPDDAMDILFDEMDFINVLRTAL